MGIVEIVELEEGIIEHLDKFNLKADEIKHLIGICRKLEGREFLFGKIDDVISCLETMKFLIKKQFYCEIEGKVMEILRSSQSIYGET